MSHYCGISPAGRPMTNLIEQAVAKANAEYFYPLSVWLDMDGFFVRQNDWEPLTRREIPESIKGERQDETSDWPQDREDRHNSPVRGQAKSINAMRGGGDD